MGFFAHIIESYKRAKAAQAKPLEDIIEQTKTFLKPQINELEKSHENPYSTILFESLAYSIALGEQLSERKILQVEIEPFLYGVFGEEYQPRVEFLLQRLKETYDTGTLDALVLNIQKTAVSDVRNGMLNSSAYLVTQAGDAGLRHHSSL